MKVARFRHDGEISYGVVHGPEGSDPGAEPSGAADWVVDVLAGHPLFDPAPTGLQHPLSAVRLLAPVTPINIVCLGRNYAEHVKEMGEQVPAEPVVFLKPPTSVIGPADPIRLPAGIGRVDHEAELAVVIGRPARDVAPAEALSYVWGYTCANDVSARELQKSDGQWTRAKGQDTFCPLGPWIETELDPYDRAVRCIVDGELRQDGNTRDLLADVPAALAYISAFMTLLPGDVVLTGTPAGVGPLLPGDAVSVSVEGIGTLTNPVVAR